MIRFRPLSSDDFPLLLEWLQRPHVKDWWDDGDDTLEKVVAHYSAAPETTKRFILVRDGEDAGYFQYHTLAPDHIGTDQFLAHGDQLNQGVGTECLITFIAMIAETQAPAIISVDPDVNNRRAIRCYEKCGFVHQPARSSATVHFMTRACEPSSH